jgi:hypothetical protein
LAVTLPVLALIAFLLPPTSAYKPPGALLPGLMLALGIGAGLGAIVLMAQVSRKLAPRGRG